MVGRLIEAARALGTPRCPSCGQTMQLAREEQCATRPVVFELSFVCARCGEHTRVVRGYDVD